MKNTYDAKVVSPEIPSCSIITIFAVVRT